MVVGGGKEHQSITCSQQLSLVLCHAPLGVFQAWCDITVNCIFQYSFLPFHKLNKYFWIMECTTHFVQNIYFHLYSTDLCIVNIYLLITGRLYKFNFLDNSSQANVVWVSCTLLFLLYFWCGLCKGSVLWQEFVIIVQSCYVSHHNIVLLLSQGNTRSLGSTVKQEAIILCSCRVAQCHF